MTGRVPVRGGGMPVRGVRGGVPVRGVGGGDGWRVLNCHWPATWREGEGGKRELLVIQFLILI